MSTVMSGTATATATAAATATASASAPTTETETGSSQYLGGDMANVLTQMRNIPVRQNPACTIDRNAKRCTATSRRLEPASGTIRVVPDNFVSQQSVRGQVI